APVAAAIFLSPIRGLKSRIARPGSRPAAGCWYCNRKPDRHHRSRTTMAKMFYTLDEAKAALGRSEDEIKQFAREGRLREFRDGPRLMFKADQVEQLRAELGAGGDTVDLGVSDSGGMIGLVDTTGASGTSITLAEADSGSGTGAGMSLKEDTSMDLGPSGSLGGVPSPTRSGSLSGSM